MCMCVCVRVRCTNIAIILPSHLSLLRCSAGCPWRFNSCPFHSLQNSKGSTPRRQGARARERERLESRRERREIWGVAGPDFVFVFCFSYLFKVFPWEFISSDFLAVRKQDPPYYRKGKVPPSSSLPPPPSLSFFSPPSTFLLLLSLFPSKLFFFFFFSFWYVWPSKKTSRPIHTYLTRAPHTH